MTNKSEQYWKEFSSGEIKEVADKSIKTKDELGKCIERAIKEFYDNTGVIVTNISCTSVTNRYTDNKGTIEYTFVVKDITFTME